jgi:hypothetical protein
LIPHPQINLLLGNLGHVLSSQLQPAPASSGFSDEELSLLEEQGITEITPGQWMRTEQQSEGRFMLIPVDPQQELLRLRRTAKGDEIMGAVGENMVNQLTVARARGTNTMVPLIRHPRAPQERKYTSIHALDARASWVRG